MAKSVQFKTPIPKPAPTVDDWIKNRGGEPEVPAAAKEEASKRLTLDVSPSLHRRIKATCAERGEKMADVLRALLEREFPG